MKILITAFEPFGGEGINPSLEAAMRIPGDCHGHRIFTSTVPVTFAGAVPIAMSAIDAFRPDVVLSLGQAGGRHAITPERIAINLDESESPDNAGYIPTGMTIEPDGPAAYFATLPNKAMVAAIRAEGIPALVSPSAGTYVCNHLMYGVLHAIATTPYEGMRAGFVHVPFLPEQAATRQAPTPSLSLDDITRGLIAAIGAL